MYLGHVKVLLGMFLSLKTLYRKRTVIWPFYFYTIIRTLSTIKRGINTSLSLYSLEQNIIAINALKYPESYNFEELIEAIPDNSENIFNDIQRSTNFSIVWILPISSIDNMPIKDMVHTSNVINKNFQLTNLGSVLLKNKLVEWSLYLKDQRINPIIYMETPTEDRN